MSTEQNYNMINGPLNNTPAMSTRPPKKELDKALEV